MEINWDTSASDEKAKSADSQDELIQHLWPCALFLFCASVLNACSMTAGSAVLHPDDGTLHWSVMSFEGDPARMSAEDLLAASTPHNGGVATQVDFVLEHSLGWQRAGIDFQQARHGQQAPADILIFVIQGKTVPCAEPGAAGCATLTTLHGRPVCLILAANRWRSSILINHEIGHCLGLEHSDGPGVMTAVYSSSRSWPTDEEIAAVPN